MITLLHTKARRYVSRNVGVPFLIPEGDGRNKTHQRTMRLYALSCKREIWGSGGGAEKVRKVPLILLNIM